MLIDHFLFQKDTCQSRTKWLTAVLVDHVLLPRGYVFGLQSYYNHIQLVILNTKTEQNYPIPEAPFSKIPKAPIYHTDSMYWSLLSTLSCRQIPNVKDFLLVDADKKQVPSELWPILPGKIDGFSGKTTSKGIQEGKYGWVFPPGRNRAPEDVVQGEGKNDTKNLSHEDTEVPKNKEVFLDSTEYGIPVRLARMDNPYDATWIMGGELSLVVVRHEDGYEEIITASEEIFNQLINARSSQDVFKVIENSFYEDILKKQDTPPFQELLKIYKNPRYVFEISPEELQEALIAQIKINYYFLNFDYTNTFSGMLKKVMERDPFINELYQNGKS